MNSPLIKLPSPRRTWLVQCEDAFGAVAACTISVENGSIAIYAPADSENFQLRPTGIAEFREAFAEAIEVAEADLRARATG
jgi:hypothetical protein